MKENGEKISIAGDGKFDSPGRGLFQFGICYQDICLGWSAKNCTYVLQSLETKKIIGVWVADKSMVQIDDLVFISN